MLAQQLANHFAGPVTVGAEVNNTVLALRSSRQQHQLGIGAFHRDPLFGCDGVSRRHH
jgi:hypothetical protein